MKKKAEDFQPGQNVQYIPQHAPGSPKCEDYDHGQVTSIDAAEQQVMVRFIGNGSTQVACKPHHIK